jgi:hypothetical protein
MEKKKPSNISKIINKENQIPGAVYCLCALIEH